MANLKTREHHLHAQAGGALLAEIKALDLEIEWDEACLTTKRDDRDRLKAQLNELDARYS